MRLWPLAWALALVACSSPRIVDCDPDPDNPPTGRFVRFEGEAWCVYSGPGTCPGSLPVEHELGGRLRACAAERVDPVPSGLCLAAGLCGDAG